MKFDVFIMNPPYGKNSSLAAKTLEKTSKISKEILYLCPKNILKYKNILSHTEDIKEHKNCFESVDTGKLIVAKYNLNCKNLEKYEDIVLKNQNPKLKILRDATFEYNKDKKDSFYCIDGSCLYKKFNKTLKDASKQILPESFKDLENKNCRELMEEGYMFYITVRGTTDGVHFNDPALDRDYNFRGIWDTKNEYACHGHMLCFCSVNQRNNFREWWYSCTKKYNSKKECNKRGLTNTICKLLYNNSSGILNYLKCMPQVDWSRTWSDEEILEEIGLSRDFLNDID